MTAETEIERALVQIWAETLQRPTVDRNDNFFELGGDSLTAMLVTERIQDRFGIELPYTTLFAHSTVGTLATAITAENTGLI
jgi:acyl carrier protein